MKMKNNYGRVSNCEIQFISQANVLANASRDIERSAYKLAGYADSGVVGELMLISANLEKISKHLNKSLTPHESKLNCFNAENQSA